MGGKESITESRAEELSVAQLEEAIAEHRSRELAQQRTQLIHQRTKKLWSQHAQNKETGLMEFSKAEVLHLIELNCRLIELQHQVFNQVSRITMNLQREIAAGNHDYDAFNIEGFIFIEQADFLDDNVPEDELLNILIDATPHYDVLMTSDHTTQKKLDEEISNYINWWSNWEGHFKSLVCEHNTPMCRAFKYLFDKSDTLAPEDIMKIQSKQFQTQITINI